MKKNLTTLTVLVMMAFGLSIEAQNPSNGNVIIDDKAFSYSDVIECYGFKKIQISFPITNEMFVHDRVVFSAKFSHTDTTVETGYAYYVELNKSDMMSNFAKKKVGVITIYDGNRAKPTILFGKNNDALVKQEFYLVYDNDKINSKPMKFTIAVKDVKGYEEKYDPEKNAIVKKPIYSDDKYIVRQFVKFSNPAHKNSESGGIASFGKKNKEKQKAFDEKVAALLGCSPQGGKAINVKMNTSNDLDSFYGYIEN